ncbi:uncharacterized protein FIBRA_06962 [Fibroporia radiculosa]|uniref:HTH TFE/IIEalpha-type domain-containing protein n=1 Tax=Fibroporia radiculosa TaxID=599839 RepID=J4IBJ5_9APHY|nr:uncharacterized protein FIBRA_06962 [Fibroporia radiculosa]CCM04771.1 predicted protein [Fibroporia radiculosa]
MSTLNKDEQETLRLLVQHVSRAFYEPKYTVVMDQLCARFVSLKDDDLAGRMGLQLKELNKIMAVLESDRLVKIYRQNELKEGAQRSVGRQYYFIDYQHFCNVVKWRVAEMRRIIDSSLRNELDNKGYICPQCGKSFSPLDADKLIDFTSGMFICDICRAEVVENENAESVRGSQDRMQRFNRQMRFLREGLRRTEDMVLPAFDVAMWIKTHIIDAEKAKAAGPGGGLKIAGESGEAKQDESFGIVLSVDKDEATRREERDREAAAKRQQNALPTWHLKSTISGDLTALGIKESALAQEVQGTSVNKLPSSNDTMIGMGPHLLTIDADEDVKPDITQSKEEDYYDQYYASLAASAAPSANDTPNIPGAGSDFGEEDDVKPSVEYLQSLNEYRKRSRSEDDVDGGRGIPKTPRLLGDGIVTASSSPGSSQHSSAPPATPSTGHTSLENVAVAGKPFSDPVVYVNGEPVALSAITEEHQEMMTPEEYTMYFEVLTAHS